MLYITLLMCFLFDKILNTSTNQVLWKLFHDARFFHAQFFVTWNTWTIDPWKHDNRFNDKIFQWMWIL